MIADEIYFKGYSCFQEWVGFKKIEFLNVIIGRNNSGKSHLIDLAEKLCEPSLRSINLTAKCTGKLSTEDLTSVFHHNNNGGDLLDNHWLFHGTHFVDRVVTWESIPNQQISNISYPPINDSLAKESKSARNSKISPILTYAKPPLAGRRFFRLSADRDITPEVATHHLDLSENGKGASNIFRKFILTTDNNFPRNIIQKDLLSALNKIFSPDGHFTEIQIKVHDHKNILPGEAEWEIFLGESQKSLIQLSKSGSGLKTIFLTLVNLLVLPFINKINISDCVFAFEELENNLHPSLLRRLLQFIEDFATQNKCVVFLTTHSSAALDLFSQSRNCQIIHVSHNGLSANATVIKAHFDLIKAINELGVRPSDLLQANGIIWVEGPSDRIYINKWIEIFSNGKFKEGRDYQCAFFGGSLLARLEATSPETSDPELVNIVSINHNVALVCDSDRHFSNQALKERVFKIKQEIDKISNSFTWVTACKEIENYIPGTTLIRAGLIKENISPDKHENFFPKKRSRRQSFQEKNFKIKSTDKMSLAIASAQFFDKGELETRFDLKDKIEQLISTIESWNGIKNC